MEWQISTEIANCDTVYEFKNLMSNKKILREHNFFDSVLKLKRSPSRFVDFKTEVKNEIFDLSIRTFLYIMFNDYTEFVPQNSGEHSFSCAVKANFLKLERVFDKNILSLDEISVDDMKKALVLYLQESELKLKKTFLIYARRLKNYIRYEEYFPAFLRFNIFVKEYILEEQYLELWDLYKNDSEEDEIDEETKVIKKNLKDAGFFSDRGIYSIQDMTKIIRSSKNYIEENYDECMEVLKILVERRQKSTNSEKSRYLYNYFRDSKKENKLFKHELLKKYQRLANEKPIYIIKNGVYEGVGAKIEIDELLYMVDLLEASCISILLLGTAMRVGELIELKRNYIILEATFPNLVRVVFKTANNKDGEEYSNPIPRICLKCLDILSQITELKDYKNQYESILVSSIYSSDPRFCDSGRVSMLINKISKYAGVKKPPLTHQFRHCIAYLVASSDDKDGLELASILLTHKNTNMTIRYLSMFNIDIYNASAELNKLNSEKLIDKIVDELSKDKKVFGQKAKYINPNTTFVGKQAKEFSLSLKKNLRRLIEEEKFAIVQSTHCLCIHDLSSPNDMKCHLGYDFSDEIGTFPLTSRCKSAECKNAIFTESDIEKLKELYGHFTDDEIRKRLEENTYFLKLGGIDSFDPFRKLMDEYELYKKEELNYG